LIKDARVLDRLLKLEDHYTPRCDYFKIVQKEIKPFMRNLVVHWMFEVSLYSLTYNITSTFYHLHWIFLLDMYGAIY